MNNRNGNISPINFIDRVIKLNEKGLPWRLSPHQRRVLELAFRRGPDGALLYRQVVLSEPKKSGKTFIAACLALVGGDYPVNRDHHLRQWPRAGGV
jgi:hypothetical protein